jgi:sodium-independent sulfate anion transporter 11
MSNELLASGLANIFGSFFCSYPGTGAFARTAVMSKSGTRTPLTSFFVGIIVVLAIYVFVPAFTYIPNASLAAIIAHSVSDLIFGPSVWKKFWDLNLSEILIFALAYIIALVARIDISVYVPVAVSLVIQLYRISRPQYAVLGRMDLDPERDMLEDEKLLNNNKKVSAAEEDSDSFYSNNNDVDSLNHALFYPLEHPQLGRYTRPIDSEIICFQPLESIVFQNASYIAEKLLDEIKLKTRRGKPPAEKVGDRAWNNAESMDKGQERPLLKAVVLDLSGCHQMDYTGMEAIRGVAVATERYTGAYVRWYIVTGDSTTVRKSLLFAGFGNQRRDLKLPGHFLSDLLNGVEEGGHVPGIQGCCSSQDQEVDSMADEKGSHAHQPFDEIVTIEQARRPSSRALGSNEHHESVVTFDSSNTNQDNIEALSELSSNSTTNESAQWCYCNIKSNPKTVKSIVAVHDLFPFFFRSLHDAVRAALLRKQEEMDDQELEQISIISDRGIDSPAPTPVPTPTVAGSSRSP